MDLRIVIWFGSFVRLATFFIWSFVFVFRVLGVGLEIIASLCCGAVGEEGVA
jgi:hypothetical protein